MGNLEAEIMELFSKLVYQPHWVYFWVFVMMLAGSFGLPIPEEVALISVGLVAYMGTRPDLYPPPYDGAPIVNGYSAAVICFIAVLGSDTIVFLLGKQVGKKIMTSERFKKWIRPGLLEKISAWTQKYGIWTSGIFRFTPALRFPGFLSCGILGIPLWKFLTIDGFAALISVPTQVILVYLYGESILANFKKFKIVIFSILGVIALLWLLKKIYDWKFAPKNKVLSPE